MTKIHSSQERKNDPAGSATFSEIAGRVIVLEEAVKQMLSVHPQPDLFVNCFPERLLDALLPYAKDCELVTAAQHASLKLLAVLARD